MLGLVLSLYSMPFGLREAVKKLDALAHRWKACAPPAVFNGSFIVSCCLSLPCKSSLGEFSLQ